MGGDLDQQVTQRKILPGEPPFLWAEDESSPTTVIDGVNDVWEKVGEGDDPLFWAPIGNCRSSYGERAVSKGFAQALGARSVLEEGFGSNGRLSFAPVRLVRRDDSEMREAEVSHCTRRRPDVERIARRDEDHFDAIALGFGEQG